MSSSSDAHSIDSNEEPLKAVKQNAKDLFYIPLFLEIAQRYLDVRENDQKELAKFVADRTLISVKRLNVRPSLS